MARANVSDEGCSMWSPNVGPLKVKTKMIARFSALGPASLVLFVAAKYSQAILKLTRQLFARHAAVWPPLWVI